MDKSKTVSWERAIEILRESPENQDLIFNAYLTSNLEDNCRRFFKSTEFSEVLNLIKTHHPKARKVLDMPGGNGIATFAFLKANFDVTVVEPDPSESVGRGAIKRVLKNDNLNAEIVDAYGEKLPFANNTFDLVYVRQGLHHASNLNEMLREISRVLRPSGLLIACREHVVDNYELSLKSFLDTQVDHQLYGGENAFLLKDYLRAIEAGPLRIVSTFGPYDSDINLFPDTQENLKKKILQSLPAKILKNLFSQEQIFNLGRYVLNKKKTPGRLYSFLARKETP